MTIFKKRLLIVYHSMTGGTLQMARSAAAGAARDNAVEVSMVEARAATVSHLLTTDGFVFASPENLAAMSGMLKDFFDRTYYTALDKLNGRPYLTLICAGSDGRMAAQQIARIATGWRLREVAPPLIVWTQSTSPDEILAPKVLSEADLKKCDELGQTIAGGMALGIF